MEKKWCSSCQIEKPKEGFKLVTTANNVRRWKCGTCLERASTQKYKGKNNG